MSDLKTQKMNQLKEFCKKCNLKMTGKRDEILMRIRKYNFHQKLLNNDKNKKNIEMIPHETEENLCQLRGIYEIEVQNEKTMQIQKKKYNFIWDKNKNKVIQKQDCRSGKLSDLTREDIYDLKSKNIDFEIPEMLKGDAIVTRKRDVEENDFEFEDCELEEEE